MPRTLIAVGLAAGILLSGCGGTRLITGTITVFDKNLLFGEELTGLPTVCLMSEGYRDIKYGASVTVRDGAGEVLGISELKLPTSVKANSCEYPFEVSVSNSEFYSIKIGNRREVIFSRADLESQGWTLGLTLGP
jgi:hypothetical protein